MLNRRYCDSGILTINQARTDPEICQLTRVEAAPGTVISGKVNLPYTLHNQQYPWN